VHNAYAQPLKVKPQFFLNETFHHILVGSHDVNTAEFVSSNDQQD